MKRPHFTVLADACHEFNRRNKEYRAGPVLVGAVYIFSPANGRNLLGIKSSAPFPQDKEDIIQFIEIEIALFLMRGVGENTFQL